jgi:hypothetical protein
MEKEYVIKGIATIHFKTGTSLKGDLPDFIFCANTEEMIKLLTDVDRMKRLEDEEIAIINLSEVSFIDIKEIRILVNDNKSD